MIITNVQELRLYFPSHAIDSIDPYVGFIDNSEHDFLLEPLGLPLYERMCQWYEQNQSSMSSVIDQQTGYFNRLVLLSQRCVAFDAMGRDVGLHGVSINNAGLNFAQADDYPRADDKAVQQFRATCQKEAHASLNRLLYTLEQWCKGESNDEELQEICQLWQQSRYYYLAAGMLISSAQLMQEYLNIYDSREKFIQMLPDLRFIQEEQIAPAIGEEFIDFMVQYAATSPVPPHPRTSDLLDKILHKLRKVAATMMEGRTQILKIDDRRRAQARDEGVLLLGRLCDMIKANQESIIEALGDNAAAFTTSPLYVAPVVETPQVSSRPCGEIPPCPCDNDFKNNAPGSALFVTPPLL